MTNHDLKARVRKAIARAFEIDVVSLPDDADTESVPQWDSLGHMTLIEVLEEDFDVALEHADAVLLLSEADIIAVLQDKQIA